MSSQLCSIVLTHCINGIPKCYTIYCCSQLLAFSDSVCTSQ